MAVETQTPEVMTTAEVADAAKVTVRTIWRWVEAGKLTPVRITSRTWRFRTEDVRALLEGRSPPAA